MLKYKQAKLYKSKTTIIQGLSKPGSNIRCSRWVIISCRINGAYWQKYNHSK